MLFSWMLSDSPGFQSGRKEFNRFRFLIDSVRQKKTNRMMFLKIKRGSIKNKQNRKENGKRRWQLNATSAVAKSCKQQAITRTSRVNHIVIFDVISKRGSSMEVQWMFNECRPLVASRSNTIDSIWFESTVSLFNDSTILFRYWSAKDGTQLVENLCKHRNCNFQLVEVIHFKLIRRTP